MAVVIASPSADLHPQPKPNPNMTSLSDDHVPTSNGVNGHVHPAAMETTTAPVEAASITAVAKNAEAFDKNESIEVRPGGETVSPDETAASNPTAATAPSTDAVAIAPELMADVSAEATAAEAPETDASEKPLSAPDCTAPPPTPDAAPSTADLKMHDAPAALKPAIPPAASSSSGFLPSLRDDSAQELAAVDTAMVDAPSHKVPREREDDTEGGRSVKRARTEDADVPSVPAVKNHIEAATTTANAAAGVVHVELPPIVIPPRVRASSKAGSLADPALDNAPISPYANREIRRVLASIKKTKVGNNFKDPVHKKWPFLWDSYILRVAKPMDIGQIERNLRENAYGQHGDFINDLFLIFENSVAFNGLGNIVTDEAKSLVDNFFGRLAEIASQEPHKADKKDAKQLPTRQTEPRAAASRRESRGAATSPIEESVIAKGASPVGLPVAPGGGTAGGTADANASVFAVPASGMPIIRRDSTKMDGDRPKRPIHPPKNRDLGYEPKNPKKKLPEFRFCEEVLKELMKQRHYETNHWFLRPVDAVAMLIPTYHKVIKKPMDLGTMQTKLAMGEYTSTKEFEGDVQLIIRNCRKFNVVGEVVDAANRLEDLFKAKWADKDSWIAAHTTHAPVLSPAGGKDDDSDDDLDGSDADGDDLAGVHAASDTVDALVKRLEEENTRLSSLLMAKIPDMTMITTQQTVLNMIQKQIVEEKTKLAQLEADRKARKPGKSKFGKKKAAAGGAGGRKASMGAAGAAASRKAFAAAKKVARPKSFGLLEKNVVTEGINNLDVQQLEKAIDIIKKDTNQEESESGELELDIDQLSQDALGKLYDLIVKAFPHMRVKSDRKAAAGEAGVGKPAKPKKHKPMGRLEQERNIEKLREIKAQFQRPGSGSQEPLPSVEMLQGAEEESEEESEVDSEEE